MTRMAGIVAACLSLSTNPAPADEQPGLTGPAAGAVAHALTDGEVMHCYNTDVRDVTCNMQRNDLNPHVYYGDANGRGPNSDVIVITFYTADPTGNASDVSVAYFRRDRGRYRYVRTYQKVYLGSIAPGSRVTFGKGRASFVGVTLRPQDSYATPGGRTRYVLDLR